MIGLTIAVKNIRANRKRTVITILLCTMTTGLLVFSSAWMDGSHQQMIKSAVEIYPGYLQITQKDFRDNPSYEHLIFKAHEVAGVLAGMEGIDTFAPRFESYVLYAGEEKSVGGMLTGIVPDREARLSRLASSLEKGRYLTDADTNQVYMGKELAERLEVGPGDEVAFIGSAADYSFAADNLVVAGIFQTGLFDFDSSTAFVNKSYFDTIMASHDMATHFIVLPEDPAGAPELARAIQAGLSPEYRAEPWQETMSGLVEAMLVDSIFGYITLGIIFIVIFFVVMIYTLLAVFARIREIGILRAIGTSPSGVLAMLLTESAILGLVSVILGGLIGGAFAYYFSVNPFEFSGYEEQFKQYGLAATAMPAEFSPLTILRDMTIMFVLSILSTLYPIVKVNRFRPVEAIQHV